MHLSGRKNAFFGDASPQFEKNKAVQIVQIVYDEKFIRVIMLKAEKFWKNSIGKFVVQ